MGPLRAVPIGFQQIAGGAMTSATNLTLPHGAQQAQGSSCNLLGNTLTVGGTVTGAFAVGQVAIGTGIPANTTIVDRGAAPNTWVLSAQCTTETAETVTGYAQVEADMAIIKATTASVNWRDDGTAPTAPTGTNVGMTIQTTDPLFEYFGALQNIQFISATGGINVSYYKLVG